MYFLGPNVANGVLQKGERLGLAVGVWPEPQIVTKLSATSGTGWYYCLFLKECSKIARPILYLLGGHAYQ